MYTLECRLPTSIVPSESLDDTGTKKSVLQGDVHAVFCTLIVPDLLLPFVDHMRYCMLLDSRRMRF